MALYAIDGTFSERKHLSNVYYFAHRYAEERSAFWSGPGTPAASLGWGLSGALFGTGSSRLVEQVIERIRQDRRANPRLRIDLVGFSRGAAIALEVAWTLHTRGFVTERTEDSTVRDIPSVRFLGLFDTVHSMGFPMFLVGGPKFLGNRRWKAEAIPPNVINSAQAISDDERRSLFRGTNLPPPVPTRGHFHEREKFEGVHSDVGGHIENNPVLARIALRWMITKARAAGIRMHDTGLVTDAEIIDAQRNGALNPTGGQATGARPWAY